MVILSNVVWSQCPDCHISTSSNLVTNGNFENGYSGFYSDYLIGNKGPGYFIVDRDASIYYQPYTGKDHTTGNSRFLIVDGDDKNGKRVWYQDISVMPNTDYYFSCWVTNIFVEPVTRLQFSINGLDIGSPFSPPLTYLEWRFFYIKWNSGANTSAKLAINNKVIIFQGNDFGIDDISFTTCKPDPFFDIDIGNDTSICSEDSIILDAGGGFSSYAWNNGAKTRAISAFRPDIYSVITMKNGCYARDTMKLGSLPIPYIGFDADYIICEVKQETVSLTIHKDYECLWLPSGDTMNTAIIDEAGYRQCIVTDNNGCMNKSFFEIRNLCYPVIFVPNAFYPDGDGLNDVFNASCSNIVGFKMVIYNRWGEMIYETIDMLAGWDGSYGNVPCQQDVYFWVIDYYGLTSDKQKIPGSTSGTVNLLR